MRKAIAGVLVLVVLGLLLVGIKTVQPNEIAIASRFGNLFEGTKSAGMHFDPFATYIYFPTRLVIYNSTETSATKDLQDVNVEVAFNYKFREDAIRELYLNTGDFQSFKERVLQPMVSSTVKSTTTKYNAEGILTKRGEMEQEILQALKLELEQYKVDGIQMSITNLYFPNEDFNRAIEQKQIAEQKALQEKFNLDSARLQAEQQEVQKQSLTPAILQKMWIEKWDGVLPKTVAGEDQILMIPSNQ